MKPPDLFDYGIAQEHSDIRAHVSPTCRAVFVYRTKDMLALISARCFPERDATQEGANGRPTGRGFIVPVSEVPDIRTVRPSEWRWRNFPPKHGSTTTEKGRAAVEIVQQALEAGRFPLWVGGAEAEDRETQIEGTDIIVCCNHRIQVKCDYEAGPKAEGGTGNLFIQTAEANPFKRH